MIVKTLQEIADYLDARLVGNGGVTIKGVKGIEEAEEGDLTFVSNSRYRSKLAETRASAVLVSPDTECPGRNLLLVKDPYASLARVLQLLYPPDKPAPGIRPGAFVEEGAEIAPTASIYPNTYIGRNAKIGERVVIHPGVCIGKDVSVGEDSVLYPNVVIRDGCRIGRRVILQPGVTIGGDGFGFANPGTENLKILQVGTVQIDDDVEIGANSTVDRGALGKTWIQKGVKIDNLVMIAHNVVIGENSIIVSQVGISGSTKVGKSVILAGQVGLVGHIEIGDGVMIGAQSGVAESIPAGQMVSGSPTMPHRVWLRVQAIIPTLPEMRKTLKALLKRVEQLEQK